MATLGHAASAEDGSGFGMPGDQTGREVRLETLGKDGNNWVYIYRHPNTSYAYNIAEAIRQACMNENIGYSREIYTGWGLEHTRYGLWEAMSETGDIRKITKKVNCDCSQLVISAVRIAGVPGASKYRGMVTAIEDQTLLALGFKKYGYNLYTIRKGDILWREGHTGVVVDGNENTFTRSPSTTPKTVKAAADYVYVRTSPEIKNNTNGYPQNVLSSWEMLGPNNLVDVCDEDYAPGWSYIRIAGEYYGWVESKYLKAPAPVVPKAGDTVRFSGKKIYVSSYLNSKGVAAPNFNAKVVQKNNQTHPYLIKSVGSDGYEGWVNAKDIALI